MSNEKSIFESVHFLNEDLYLTESFFSPLKDYVKKIKVIKDTKPNEYDGPKEVKQFVDKNFDDIVKISKELEKEPENIRKSTLKSLIPAVVGMIGMVLGGLAEIMPIYIISYIIIMVNALITAIIACIRQNDDSKLLTDLIKIQTALKRANLSKLSDTDKRKVTTMIQSIDDCTTETMALEKKIN